MPTDVGIALVGVGMVAPVIVDAVGRLGERAGLRGVAASSPASAEAFLERSRTAEASFAGNGWDVVLQTVTEAQLAQQAGDLAGAAELYDSLERSVCTACGLFWKGFLLETAGDRAGAIAAWERYLSRGWHVRHILNADGLGSVLESLGRMHDEVGNPEQAAIYYAQFVELWQDADPELQPRVAAAQARLEDIVRERG